MDDESKRIEETFKTQIKEWKEQYGTVYYLEINDEVYIWRALSRHEFNVIRDNQVEDLEKEEDICKTCILYPEIEDYHDGIDAGLPTLLSNHILECSGFIQDDNSIKNLISECDAQMNIFDNQVLCIIKAAFPNITFEEIESWTTDKIFTYFSRAKWVLKTLYGVDVNMEKQDPNQPQNF